MTLKDFLNSKVRSYEICLVYANHSTVAISWIFEESFSEIPEKYLNWTVKGDELLIYCRLGETEVTGFPNQERPNVYREGMALKFFGDLVCDYLGEERIARTY